MSFAPEASRSDMSVEQPESPTTRTQIAFEPENPEQNTDGSTVEGSDNRADSRTLYDSENKNESGMLVQSDRRPRVIR
jgi:hypothetical protein